MGKQKTARRKRDHTPPAIGAMTIERVSVSKLNPAPYNPRKDLKPGDPEYQALKRSIDEFGYVDPLIWNKRTGTLVGGHQRLKVLVNEHAATEVDVSVVDLDEAAEKALNVALNKIAGAWDDPALAKLRFRSAGALGESQRARGDLNSVCERRQSDLAGRTA